MIILMIMVEIHLRDWRDLLVKELKVLMIAFIMLLVFYYFNQVQQIHLRNEFNQRNRQRR